MFRFIILFLTLIFLAGCKGSENTTLTIDGSSASLYTWEGFTVYIPTTWSASGTIENLPAPAHGTVVMASISPQTKYHFSHNFLILKDTLTVPMSSEAYSIANNKQTMRKYAEYTPVNNEAIIFGDDDHSRVYVFDAQYNTQTPRMRFLQTAKVCGTTVYLLHIAIGIDRDPANYIQLIRTFTCK